MDKAIDWLHAPSKAAKRVDVFDGNFFSVSRVGNEWMIWRFAGEDDEKELIVLTDEAMDELRGYFAESYAEDRAAVACSHAWKGDGRFPVMDSVPPIVTYLCATCGAIGRGDYSGPVTFVRMPGPDEVAAMRDS